MNKPKNGYVFEHKRPGARLGHLAKDKFGRGRLALHMLIQGDQSRWRYFKKGITCFTKRVV